MPKKLPNGVWEILLDNKLGTNDDYDIEMIGSHAGPGQVERDALHRRPARKNVKYGAKSSNPLVPQPGHLRRPRLRALRLRGQAVHLRARDALRGRVRSAGGHSVFGESVFYCAIFDVNGADSQYYLCANGFTATIDADSGGQIAGTFGGTMDNLPLGRRGHRDRRHLHHRPRRHLSRPDCRRRHLTAGKRRPGRPQASRALLASRGICSPAGRLSGVWPSGCCQSDTAPLRRSIAGR